MKILVQFMVDVATTFYAVLLAFKLSPSFTEEIVVDGWISATVFPISLGASLMIALVLYVINSGDVYLRVGRIETTIRTLIGCFVGMIAFVSIYGIINNELFGRYVFVFATLISWVFTSASRLFIETAPAQNCRSIYFLGVSDEYKLLTEIVRSSTRGISVVGSTIVTGEGQSEISSVQEKLWAENKMVTDIVVGGDVAHYPKAVDFLMAATMSGRNVIEISAFCEKYLRCVFNQSIKESWFWQYDANHLRPFFTVSKRYVDIIIAIPALILSLPFGLVIMLLLKLQDGGPVIYSQIRSGYMGKPFRIYKFRSMRMDAEKRGAQWAQAGDSRVTRLGRILRKTRLDELPQFWNILKGDMSFVGPRPERPEFVAEIERQVEFFRCRSLVKPGLTGWAQINFPYASSIEDSSRKLSYDLYYIKHASLFLDTVIVLRTLIAMVKGAQ